jgi:hypothetical protein
LYFLFYKTGLKKTSSLLALVFEQSKYSGISINNEWNRLF